MAIYGTSSCTTDRLRAEEAFDLIAAAGFSEIELCGSVGYFDHWEAKPAAYLTQRLKASGLWARTVHVHIPGWPLGDRDAERRIASLDAATACLVHTAMVGAEIMIVHPNGWAGSHDRRDYELVRSRSTEDIATLAERAQRVGVRIAIENMFQQNRSRPGCNVRELLQMIDGLGDHVGICIDTGHSHLDGLSPADEVLVAGSKLMSLHLADNDGTEDQHRVPGMGTIDWAPFLAALEQVGYNGPRMFEIGHRDSADDRALLAQQMKVVRRWEQGQ